MAPAMASEWLIVFGGVGHVSTVRRGRAKMAVEDGKEGRHEGSCLGVVWACCLDVVNNNFLRARYVRLGLSHQ